MPDHPTASTAHAGSGHHGFDFELLNASHNKPYPAVEWIHGHAPQLILDLPAYAERNQAVLLHDQAYAQAKPTAAHLAWAKDHVAKRGAGDAEILAKAMTVADGHAWATMPRALSFFNHQTFWSTVALAVAAIILLVVARRRPDQLKPAGRVQHLIEMLVLFVRDEIVRPNMPHHPDAWTPFIASLFFALLACNLFGLVPLFGTATGDFVANAAFALPVLLLMVVLGFVHNGPGFPFKLVPTPWSWSPMNIPIWLLLFVIELFSLFVKPTVLALRLFANMLAGHTLLLVFASLGFIVCQASPDSPGLFTGLGIASWVITVAFYALELLVAFIQAYVFALLATLFIGSCIHPEH